MRMWHRQPARGVAHIGRAWIMHAAYVLISVVDCSSASILHCLRKQLYNLQLPTSTCCVEQAAVIFVLLPAQCFQSVRVQACKVA